MLYICCINFYRQSWVLHKMYNVSELEKYLIMKNTMIVSRKEV